ncbi:MAG: nuclear transport factor 2 family protein [Ruminococcus sp.]|nr:nuclear transport factor 2 family protein [Ruminococcus sp.]
MKYIVLLLAVIFFLSSCGTKSTDTVQRSTSETKNYESSDGMNKYDFADFSNVELINTDTSTMSEEQLEILYQQAKYCQAMTEADIDTMLKLVSEDMIFIHMSGRTQTREEYFADVTDGSLQYFTIGIDSPTIEVNGDSASMTYTSVLNANAYGARGTFRMVGTHYYERCDGAWIAVNAPNR